MSTFAFAPASFMASCILATVLSMLITTPRLTPEDSDFPYPKISNLLYWFHRPTIAAILLVPISRPTIISELFICGYFLEQTIWFLYFKLIVAYLFHPPFVVFE